MRKTSHDFLKIVLPINTLEIVNEEIAVLPIEVRLSLKELKVRNHCFN